MMIYLQKACISEWHIVFFSEEEEKTYCVIVINYDGILMLQICKIVILLLYRIVNI